MSCFQWFKDTNLKANHNSSAIYYCGGNVVSNGSKILIWKQITTHRGKPNRWKRCFQWFKDTNLKANHNSNGNTHQMRCVVSNGSKILIWKQITTLRYCNWNKDMLVVSNGSKILIWKQITTLAIILIWLWSCFQWFKDTNLKANHNSAV